jgi:hypothetical protein
MSEYLLRGLAECRISHVKVVIYDTIRHLMNIMGPSLPDTFISSILPHLVKDIQVIDPKQTLAPKRKAEEQLLNQNQTSKDINFGIPVAALRGMSHF